MNIYVGNLSFEATEDEIREAFQSYGQVDSVSVITDKYSGRSKGFGFVEMASDSEGKAAIDALNGKDFKGRPLKVSEAKPRTESGGGNQRPRRSGGGGGGRFDRGSRDSRPRSW